MRDALTASSNADLATVLADAIADTARALDLQEGESPSTTVTITRNRDGALDLLILGDNLAILHELQTQQAQHRNREDGYWIAEANPNAAAHAIAAERPTSPPPGRSWQQMGAYNTMYHLALTEVRPRPRPGRAARRHPHAMPQVGERDRPASFRARSVTTTRASP